jgi:hypothetical protein
MREYRFRLDISYTDYLSHYQGRRENVMVTTRNGVTVQFPATALRAHVLQNGVHGEFVLRVDQDNRLLALERVGGLPA